MNYVLAVLAPPPGSRNYRLRLALAGLALAFLSVSSGIKSYDIWTWAAQFIVALCAATSITLVAAIGHKNRTPDVVASNFTIATWVCCLLIVAGSWPPTGAKPAAASVAPSQRPFTFEEALAPALGPVDQWRFDRCMTAAAQAPTSAGVTIATQVCRRKFDQ